MSRANSSVRGGAEGQPPFADVGEELADGDDPHPPVSDGQGRDVGSACLGQRGEPGLEVRLPVQQGQVGHRRVEAGQEPPERAQVAGDRRHRGRRSGGGREGAVIEEQRPQRLGDLGAVAVQAVTAAGMLRRGAEDPEVEQHLVRGEVSSRSLRQPVWLPLASPLRWHAAARSLRSPAVSSRSGRPVWISSRSTTRSADRLTMWPL